MAQNKSSAFKPTPQQLRRNPLITSAGIQMLKRLREHSDAPRWNHEAGDRLDKAALTQVRTFEKALHEKRTGIKQGPPSDKMIGRILSLRNRIISYRERIPLSMDIEKDWNDIPTMSREDLAVSLENNVPLDADLDRVIVYRTAGTSGHPLLVPHDPVAAACYQPMITYALGRYSVRPRLGPKSVACFLVGAQARTVTYPTVLSFWKGSGFAKLNIHPAQWPTPESPHRYFADLNPGFLTGDPISFAEMMRMQIPVQPSALITTAVALSLGLKKRLLRTYGCPVIDWYSLTETGPIGYACPKGHGYHILPHDLYVEALDANGASAGDGQRGEITVTGGRNPFLPLLRYRTGDWGRLDFENCPCGDPMPRILDLEGRAPVLFRSTGGGIINPVDVSRVLREFPFVQHELTQEKDLSCRLSVRPVGASESVNATEVIASLRTLLGPDAKISVRVDKRLGDRKGGGKVTPYKSELLLED
jgi:phenylacetate-CoA ligase